jgi:hypothetical protein
MGLDPAFEARGQDKTRVGAFQHRYCGAIGTIVPEKLMMRA